MTSTANAPVRLKKSISFLAAYAIATGATLSAGLFLLPGIAAAEAGPAIVLCYLLAAIPLIPAMFSVVELATAMPRAGGAYYFLDRSLGPIAGSIGGFGTWLALTLKAAFALVGMGAYISLFLADAPAWSGTAIAVGFALTLGAVNWFGAGGTSTFQIMLVLALLSILAWFAVNGIPAVEVGRFDNFLGAGSESIFATAGLVYISYVGITKVASVSEEVRDPERNLPRAVILSLITAVFVYGVCTFLMVGLLPPDELAGNQTPMAAAAAVCLGETGRVIVSIGAIIAFASVANAGILSSSRYPLAMGRDRLLPLTFAQIDRRGTPVIGVAVTVGAIILFLIAFDAMGIAKLASAFQLAMFAMLCISVIVMRESKLDSYDPGYRSPFYPWMQIAGIIMPCGLIIAMGWLPVAFSFGVILAGTLWFYYYARKRVSRHGAIYHVFERLGRQRFDELDVELRSILKEKGLRAADPFDETIARAIVIDEAADVSFEGVVEAASNRLATRLHCTAAELGIGFLEGTRTGATPVAGGVALPHLRLAELEQPEIVLVRCQRGVEIPATTNQAPIHAICFLVSPESDPARHLRMLAQLASRIDDVSFMDSWHGATSLEQLRSLLLEPERHVVIEIAPESRAASLARRALREIELPPESLVAIIRRRGHVVIPSGSTELEHGDHLTVIGTAEAVARIREEYALN